MTSVCVNCVFNNLFTTFIPLPKLSPSCAHFVPSSFCIPIGTPIVCLFSVCWNCNDIWKYLYCPCHCAVIVMGSFICLSICWGCHTYCLSQYRKIQQNYLPNTGNKLEAAKKKYSLALCRMRFPLSGHISPPVGPVTICIYDTDCTNKTPRQIDDVSWPNSIPNY